MNKYEIKEDKNYGNVLFKDGRESFCPFQQPVPTQGMGGVGLMRLPCCTNCPLANLEKEEQTIYDITTGQSIASDTVLEKVFYVTRCGSKEQKFEIFTTVPSKFL